MRITHGRMHDHLIESVFNRLERVFGSKIYCIAKIFYPQATLLEVLNHEICLELN